MLLNYLNNKIIKMEEIIFIFYMKQLIFFLTNVKSIRMDTKQPKYRVRTTSLKGNIIVENYFLNFPLFGTKYLDFLD